MKTFSRAIQDSRLRKPDALPEGTTKWKQQEWYNRTHLRVIG
jgi:hypothetical protein